MWRPGQDVKMVPIERIARAIMGEIQGPALGPLVWSRGRSPLKLLCFSIFECLWRALPYISFFWSRWTIFEPYNIALVWPKQSLLGWIYIWLTEKYGCESWTLTKADQSRITSFEMWCWRRMLRISWFMKRSSISVLEEIQPKRRLLSHVQSQMMKYFGHIARRGGNSLEKVIMQGCVKGRRRPGRPRTRWIDQIKSMVGCPLHELYNLVQDRQRWCDVVAVRAVSHDRTIPTDRPT